MWSLVECFWVFNSSVPQHTQHVNSSSWAWSGPLVALWHMPTKGPWRPRRWCCKECTPESAFGKPQIWDNYLYQGKDGKDILCHRCLLQWNYHHSDGDQFGCQGRAPCIISWVWKPWTPSITPPRVPVKRYGDNTRGLKLLLTWTTGGLGKNRLGPLELWWLFLCEFDSILVNQPLCYSLRGLLEKNPKSPVEGQDNIWHLKHLID